MIAACQIIGAIATEYESLWHGKCRPPKLGGWAAILLLPQLTADHELLTSGSAAPGEAAALKRVIAWQIDSAMREAGITGLALALGAREAGSRRVT